MAKSTRKTLEEKGLYRFGEAAKMAGVSPNQLQYYLYMQVAEHSAESDAGQRLFSPAAIKRIRMIKLLNDSGYPLREIREIFMLGNSATGRPPQER
jgi:DNA-binding transcriptional MerR regulator